MTIGKEGDLTVFDVSFSFCFVYNLKTKKMLKLREKIAEKIKIEAKNIKLSMGMSADYEEAVNFMKIQKYSRF